MSQHFLLSRAAKTLSLGGVFKMTDAEVEATFRTVRWPETNGAPVCVACGGLDAYDCRRPNGAPRFRCRACSKDFSITSGSLFASHKMPLRSYPLAVAIFANEVKGKSALALSRDLGTSYKTSFVLAHKLREAMAYEMKGRVVGGEGKAVEIDGGYFGGYVKPSNRKENRVDRRLTQNQSGKRQVAVIVRERDGKSVTGVFASEKQSVAFIRSRVAKGTEIHADESTAWDALQDRYPMKRINHLVAYSADGSCTNGAELFFSRLRRAEVGIHHHIADSYFARYAQEAAYREDNRRVANGDQVHNVIGLAMQAKPSVDFGGYWQRHIKDAA